MIVKSCKSHIHHLFLLFETPTTTSLMHFICSVPSYLIYLMLTQWMSSLLKQNLFPQIHPALFTQILLKVASLSYIHSLMTCNFLTVPTSMTDFFICFVFGICFSIIKKWKKKYSKEKNSKKGDDTLSGSPTKTRHTSLNRGKTKLLLINLN